MELHTIYNNTITSLSEQLVKFIQIEKRLLPLNSFRNFILFQIFLQVHFLLFLFLSYLPQLNGKTAMQDLVPYLSPS